MKDRTVLTIPRRFLSNLVPVFVATIATLVSSGSSSELDAFERSDLSERDWQRVKQVTYPVLGVEKYELLSGGAGTSMAAPSANSFSHPATNLTFEERQRFLIGNGLFAKVWVSSPSSTRASDGLGPLFNVRSCQRCHLKDGRGHPPAHIKDVNASMVLQLSFLGEGVSSEGPILPMALLPDPKYGFQLQDNAVAGIDSEGRFEVEYKERAITLAGGEVVHLREPMYRIKDLKYGPLHKNTVMSPRVAQPMIGLGLLEAIHESDLMALQDPEDINGDGISGRVNWVSDPTTGQRVIGRFGWKADLPTVESQSASAFLTDMGLSSQNMRKPWGDCTEGQIKCRNMIHGDSESMKGIEVPKKFLEFVSFYSRNLAVPARRGHRDPMVTKGKKVFHKAGCVSCHVPKFVTSREAAQKSHRFQLIWPYTDLLLHDMGPELGDYRVAGKIQTEWRTPPLWGIGLTKLVSGHTYFLHDGRARNLMEAILWHGGEASKSRDFVVKSSPEQRSELIRFLESL